MQISQARDPREPPFLRVSEEQSLHLKVEMDPCWAISGIAAALKVYVCLFSLADFLLAFDSWRLVCDVCLGVGFVSV